MHGKVRKHLCKRSVANLRTGQPRLPRSPYTLLYCSAHTRALSPSRLSNLRLPLVSPGGRVRRPARGDSRAQPRGQRIESVPAKPRLRFVAAGVTCCKWPGCVAALHVVYSLQPHSAACYAWRCTAILSSTLHSRIAVYRFRIV